MAKYIWNPSSSLLLSGEFDYALLQRDGYYIAWSRTKECPPRPDYCAAWADLRDMMDANGHKRLHRYNA